MSTAYLSLGSNLGDRRHNLEEAIRLLQMHPLSIVRRSSLYETEPRDLPAQPWFLNMVVEAQTALDPHLLAAHARQVETALGRERQVPKGPRTIDIDILLVDDLIVDTPDLTVPHPRMAERRFVLEPLAELASDLRHPVAGRSIRELLWDTRDQVVLKLDP